MDADGATEHEEIAISGTPDGDVHAPGATVRIDGSDGDGEATVTCAVFAVEAGAAFSGRVRAGRVFVSGRLVAAVECDAFQVNRGGSHKGEVAARTFLLSGAFDGAATADVAKVSRTASLSGALSARELTLSPEARVAARVVTGSALRTEQTDPTDETVARTHVPPVEPEARRPSLFGAYRPERPPEGVTGEPDPEIASEVSRLVGPTKRPAPEAPPALEDAKRFLRRVGGGTGPVTS